MLDFDKIKNTKKDRLIIAVNIAKIFCEMLENKMFHKDVEIKEQAVEKIFYKNVDNVQHCFIIQHKDNCTLFTTFFKDSDFYCFNKLISGNFLDFNSFKEIEETDIN